MHYIVKGKKIKEFNKVIKCISGGSRGGARALPPPLPPPPPISRTNFFSDTGPPRYLKVWVTGPPPFLKVWIRH